MGFRPVIFGSTGGTGFTLGPEQNVFTGADRAAAESARDTYFTANPSNLAQYNADTSLNIRLEFTENSNPTVTYQVRNLAGNTWLNNQSFEGVQGQPGQNGLDGLMLEFNSRANLDQFFIENPNRLINGIPVVLHMGDNVVTDLVWNGPDSPNDYVVGDQRWRTAAARVSNNSLFVGSTRVSNAVEDILVTTADGRKFLAVGVGFDSTGSQRLNDLELEEQEELNVNLLDNVVISSPFTLNYTTFGDNLTNDFSFKPNEPGDLRVRYYLGSDNTGELIFDETRSVTQSEVDSDDFINFGIGNPYLLDQGVQLHTEFSGISLKGGVVSGGQFDGQTIIAFKSDIQPFTRHPVARLSDIEGPDSSITRFDIANQSKSVLAGTTISGEKTFTYNVNHPEDIEGNLTLEQDGEILKSNILATGNSFTQTVTSVTLQNNSSVTFELSGRTNNGSRVAKTITIRAHALEEKLYFGRSQSNNPDSVDISGFQSIEAGVDGGSVSTGNSQANDYFIILTPADHDITRITDTVLQQDVTDIFTKTVGVRTIGATSYNSFVIGPLASGVSESYTLDF